MKTVFEEPQHLAAHLGGVAEYRGAPIRAVSAVGFGGLAPVLFVQRFFVLDPVLAHLAVQQHGYQDRRDYRQAHLVVDRHHAGAPGFGLAEVVFPGVETLFDTPSLKPL